VNRGPQTTVLRPLNPGLQYTVLRPLNPGLQARGGARGPIWQNRSVIVDCALYVDGHRRPGSLPVEGARAAATAPGSFVWVGLREPSPEEFDLVREEFGLHELAVEDAMTADQRPKLEVYDHTLFIAMKTARYLDQEEEVDFGEIFMFLGSDFIVVVRHGEAAELASVRRSLDSQPDLLSRGPAAVLHGIMDRVVDAYGPVVLGLAKDIDEVERDVFSPEWSNPAERIYLLKREVLEFHAAARSLVEPLERLTRYALPAVDEDTRRYFSDVYDHAAKAASQLEQYRDLLTSVLEANLAQIGVRQNEDMRKISAWVAVAVVPTLIAGIYGMNFSHMPGLRSDWGFPVVGGFMALVAGTLYWLFRRSDWL